MDTHAIWLFINFPLTEGIRRYYSNLIQFSAKRYTPKGLSPTRQTAHGSLRQVALVVSGLI